MLAAMVLLAAAFSLRFFRFGGVQKMVLGGIASGFLLYVMSKVTDDLSKAELHSADRRGLDAGARRRDDRICRAAVPGGRVMAGVASTRASSCWRLRVRKTALVLLSAATLVAGFWFDIAPAQAQIMTFPQRPQRVKPDAHAAREGRKGADAAAGDRGAVRLHQQARLGGRQRAGLSSAARRSKPTRLIYDENDQAAARRRQRAADRARRPDHLCRRDGPERRFPRRLRRLAAPRHRRRDPHGGGARRPLRRHTSPSSTRRLHRLRALQGRSQEAADLAGQGGAHDPRRQREDDLLRGRAPRILRQAGRLHALLLRARSDGEAQDPAS